MTCPNCGSSRTSVKDTLHGTEGVIYRHRRCNDCGSSFRTVETTDDGSSKFKYGWAEAYKIRHPQRSKK